MPLIKPCSATGPDASMWKTLIDNWADALDRYEELGETTSGKPELGHWNTERSNAGC